jgi:hypothetical protein
VEKGQTAQKKIVVKLSTHGAGWDFETPDLRSSALPKEL